jgi:dihydrofolate reductase
MRAIVNVTPDWGIGSENRLLVRIRADMQRFRALTTGHTIIIGRKTLATFPNSKPLPHRENIILTHDPDFTADPAIICHDLDALRAVLSDRDPDAVFVCGGEQIYRLLLPYCTGALITLTDADLKPDRFFPNLNQLPNWILTQEEEPKEEGDFTYRFLTYENTKPFSL